MSDKSTGLLLDMRKCPLFTSLNSLLDYYLVVRGVFFKGHFSNQNNQSAERSENVAFTFFTKVFQVWEMNYQSMCKLLELGIDVFFYKSAADK